MEIELFHRLIDEKKWTLILHEFNQRISNHENSADHESLLWIFENLDKEFREKNAQAHYLIMWKIAFSCGKIKLAKNYGSFILDYLIEMKRVPTLKKLIAEFSEKGLFKNDERLTAIDYILGQKTQISLEDPRFFAFHPEMWKNSKNNLKNYLLSEGEWTIEHWKLIYEYVLKFYYDKDIFLALAEKLIDLKKDNHKTIFLKYLIAKKVNVQSLEKKAPAKSPSKEHSILNVDYDQVAMDVISGQIEPSITEQKKVLITIHNLSDEELLDKGKDMVVAFGLLGMDKVVVRLCERILPLLADTKERISTYFMMGQSLFNGGDFYKAIDVVNDVFELEPVIAEEMMAFNYLKAESLMKLKKNKSAKEIFIIIKKQNPHYRMVGERLKDLEEIK